MKLRFQSSAESAAAFTASRDKRRERELREKRLARSQRDANPRPPRPPRAQPRFQPIWLPSDIHAALLAHCDEFGITPKEYVRRCLRASKLSKGGV